MKVWNDDSPAVDGYWFRSAPGAERVEGMISFRQRRTWLKSEGPIPGIGEQWEDELRYYKGQNPEKYKGKTFCGSLLSLKGGGVPGRDLGIITNEQGNSTCCGPPAAADLIGCTSKETGEPFGWQLSGMTQPDRLGLIWEVSNSSMGYACHVPGWTNILNLPQDGDMPRISILVKVLDGTEGSVGSGSSPESPGGGYAWVFSEGSFVAAIDGVQLLFTGNPTTPTIETLTSGSIRLALCFANPASHLTGVPSSPEVISCSDGGITGWKSCYRDDLAGGLEVPGAQWPGFMHRGGVISLVISV